MVANRRVGTAPELAIRRELHRRGLRFRIDLRVGGALRTRPDIVFTRARVAVFVDGCFWHRCPIHGTSPKAHSEYWTPKLDRNVERDRETDAALAALGWTVIRVWEHEPVDEAADRIEEAVRSLRAAPARG